MCGVSGLLPSLCRRTLFCLWRGLEGFSSPSRCPPQSSHSLDCRSRSCHSVHSELQLPQWNHSCPETKYASRSSRTETEVARCSPKGWGNIFLLVGSLNLFAGVTAALLPTHSSISLAWTGRAIRSKKSPENEWAFCVTSFDKATSLNFYVLCRYS